MPEATEPQQGQQVEEARTDEVKVDGQVEVVADPIQLSNDKVVGSVIVVGSNPAQSSMSDHVVAPPVSNPTNQDAHHAPQPPPFNPLPSQTSQSKGMGTSVVSDLMKVYESMTQSSTPQHPPNANTQLVPGAPAPTAQAPTAQAPTAQAPTAQAPPPQLQAQAQTYTYTQHAPAPAPVQPQGYYIQGQGYYPSQYQPAPGAPVIPPVPEYPHTQETVQSTPVAPPEQPEPSAPARSLRKRTLDKGSEKSGSKPRKKGANADGRWSKRFSWPEDLHRDFVSAIFDVGLKHSSPSAILEHMPPHEQITSERIKSHLQKYRLHRAKSKREFMSSYDASLAKFQASGVSEGVRSLASGEVAAHLTYSTATDADTAQASTTQQESTEQQPQTKTTQETAQAAPPGALILPKLTEEEKRSPIGTSLGYLMGLFFSLRQQLMAQRAGKASGAGGSTDVGRPNPDPSSSQPGIVYSQFAGVPGQPAAPPLDPNAASSPWAAPAPAPVDSQAEGDADSGKCARINLAQNNQMKRDMESQRSLQMKMRELKQQELNKYKMTAGQKDQTLKVDQNVEDAGKPMESMQGAEQTAETSESVRDRTFSFGGPPEMPGYFESPDDERLFEFLMNP